MVLVVAGQQDIAECYMAYGDMDKVIDVTEQIVYKCAMAVNNSPIIRYQGKEFDVTPPWNRIDMTNALGIAPKRCFTENGR